jgi:hypothetical protein
MQLKASRSLRPHAAKGLKNVACLCVARAQLVARRSCRGAYASRRFMALDELYSIYVSACVSCNLQLTLAHTLAHVHTHTHTTCTHTRTRTHTHTDHVGVVVALLEYLGRSRCAWCTNVDPAAALYSGGGPPPPPPPPPPPTQKKKGVGGKRKKN